MRELLRILFFFLLTLLLRVEAWQYLGSRYLGGVDYDAGLYVFLVQAARFGLDSGSWFDTRAFYPYGYSLAWSDNYILPSLLYAMFQWMAEPLRYNLLYLLCGTLNGYCAFRLFRFVRGGEHRAWALLVGTAFCTFGFFQQHFGHPQLQWAFWIPFGMECFLRAVMNRSWRASLFCGLAISGAFLSSVYYAVFLAVALFFTGCLLLPRLFDGVWTKQRVALCLGFGVAGLLPVFAVAGPYIKVSEAFGHRFLFESYFFSATLASYLSASDLSHFHKWLSVLSHPEARLFPGLVVVLLWLVASGSYLRTTRKFGFLGLLLLLQLLPYGLAVSLWVLCFWGGYSWYRERSWEGSLATVQWGSLFGLLGVVFLFLSLGPMGNTGKGEFAPGLASVLYAVFPGFSAIRAIGRIGVLAVLFLTVSSSIGLSRKFSSSSVVYLLLGLIIVDNWHPIVPLEGPVEAPRVLESIRGSEEVTIFLPLVSRLKPDGTIKSWSEFSLHNVRAMQWGEEFQLRVVNGYSGQRTMFMKKLPKVIADFPSERSIFYLKRIGGLKYVVWKSDESEADEMFATVSDELKVRARDDKGYYLLELVGNTEVSDGHIIRVPSWCDGILSFEMRGQQNQNASLLFRYSEEEKPRKEEMKYSDVWQLTNLEIAQRGSGVMPLEVEFQLNESVQLRNISFDCEGVGYSSPFFSKMN